MQLDDILNYLPFVVVDTMCSFQETNLAEFHDAILCSHQEAIEVFGVSKRIHLWPADLAWCRRPPFPWAIPPNRADILSQRWPVSWLCSAGTDTSLEKRFTVFWERRRAELILHLFLVLSHLWGVVLGRGDAEGEMMDALKSKWIVKAITLKAYSHFGPLNCWTWVFPGLWLDFKLVLHPTLAWVSCSNLRHLEHQSYFYRSLMECMYLVPLFANIEKTCWFICCFFKET